jgi:hypothetical protein
VFDPHRRQLLFRVFSFDVEALKASITKYHSLYRFPSVHLIQTRFSKPVFNSADQNVFTTGAITSSLRPPSPSMFDPQRRQLLFRVFSFDVEALKASITKYHSLYRFPSVHLIQTTPPTKMFSPLEPLPVVLGLLVLVSYSFLLSTTNSISRSHTSILLPRIYQYSVGKNISCQAFVVYDSDGHNNVNAEPLPIFLDKSYHPDCFLEKTGFETMIKSLNFARRLNGKLISQLFKVLGISM